MLDIVCTEKSTLREARILRMTFYPHQVWLTFTVASWFAGFVQEVFPSGQNNLGHNTGCLGLRESWSSSSGWWEMVLRTPEAKGDVASATQLEMKRCLMFDSFSYPPLCCFYFCGKTWNKARVKVLFIQWVVEVLTQALQTWHCLNPRSTGFWRNKASCSIAWHH